MARWPYSSATDSNKKIDRRAAEVDQLRVREHKPPVPGNEMHVGLGDMYGRRLHGFATDGLPDHELGATAEQPGQHALVARVHVLDDEDGGGELHRQGTDDHVQRFDPARGRADRHNVELRGDRMPS